MYIKINKESKFIMESYKKIKSFREVEIEENTLVICDIDDTILKYKITYEECYKIMKKDWKNEYFENDEDKEEFIRKTTLGYFEMYKKIHHKKIDHTDKDGFEDMLEKMDSLSNLCFLTARSETSNKFTNEQMNILGIDVSKYNIYYTNNTISKGDFILNYVKEVKDYKNIVFIDDYLTNIESVKEKISEVKCYKFIIL